jgi:dTDP-4-amino-4,6-dideoxygalactose transaminase
MSTPPFLALGAPYYQQRFGRRPEQWPNAVRIRRQTVSLLISPKLSETDIKRVVAATNSLVWR